MLVDQACVIAENIFFKIEMLSFTTIFFRFITNETIPTNDAKGIAVLRTDKILNLINYN